MTDEQPQHREPTTKSLSEQRQIADIKHLEAQTRHLQRPWYLEAATIKYVTTAITAVALFFYASLMGWFDDREAKLQLAQRSVDELQERELSLRQTLKLTEVHYDLANAERRKERDALIAELTQLSETRSQIQTQLDLQYAQQVLLAEIHAIGGAVAFSPDPSRNAVDLHFTASSRSASGVRQSVCAPEPQSPFEIIDPQLGTVVEAANSAANGSRYSISEIVRRACNSMDVWSIYVDSSEYVVDKQFFQVIRDSDVAFLSLQGGGCNDEIVSMLVGSDALRGVEISHTSVSPELVVLLGESCPRLQSIKFDTSYRDLSGFSKSSSMEQLRHFSISGVGELDLRWFEPMRNLLSISIDAPLVDESVLPIRLASGLKEIVLGEAPASTIGSLANCNSVTLISMEPSSDEATTALERVLPTCRSLEKLRVDFGYRAFNIGSLQHCHKLRELDLLHAKLHGEPAILEIFGELTHLSLHGSPISERSLESIAKLARLRVLDLSDLHGDLSPSPMPRMKLLSGLPGLERLPLLEVLWLDGAILSREAVESLSRMKRLTSLRLSLGDTSSVAEDNFMAMLPNTDVEFLPYVSITRTYSKIPPN